MSKAHWIVWGLIGAVCVWIFGPALLGRSTFAFRDAAHYYHPLFEYERQEWGAGRPPLWNPWENAGVPLVGETTSSIFYPGKLIFALPGGFTRLWNLYVIGHALIAAVGAYYLARRLGAGVPAAGLAALVYAFSGTVLFEHTNVVFLVGAAWLPWSLLLVEVMFDSRSKLAAVGLGVAWALMVTGGDPQMAYNSALAAGLYAVIRWRSARRDPHGCDGPLADGAPLVTSSDKLLGQGGLLAISAVVGLALAAVQVAPAWEAASRGVRGSYDAPRNVYECLGSLIDDRSNTKSDPEEARPWYAGLVGQTDDGHAGQVYQFSVGPWRAIELVWPNVGGRQFPTHRRWLEIVPAEGRIWTPSLYMSLAGLVLGAAGFSLRRTAPAWVRWMSWLAVLSAIASLGEYGPAWLIGELRAAAGGDRVASVGGEVGGLYWLLTVVLPGYVYFRYPAKLLVLTSLAVSLLAARGWDHAWRPATLGLRRALVTLAIVSPLLLAGVLVAWPDIVPRLSTIEPDPLFGPFDADGAWRDVVAGLTQTSLVALTLLALTLPVVRRRWSMPAEYAALVIVAIDLALAQGWLVPYAPAQYWRSPIATVQRLPRFPEPYRVYRDAPWLPAVWRNTSLPDRLQQSLLFDRATLRPKYPLVERVAMVESAGSVDLLDNRILWEVARKHHDPPGVNARPDPSVLDLLGVRVSLLSSQPAGTIPGTSYFAGENMASAFRATARPRAWVVHHVEMLRELQSRRPAEVRRRTERVLFPGGQPRDWSTAAVVESDAPLAVVPRGLPADPTPAERCRVTTYEPLRVVVEARLATDGLLVLADAFYPGWDVTVETDGQTRKAPIVRTNRVLRGVALPAGNHRLVFRYRPASVWLGGAISLASAATLMVAAAIGWQRRKARRAQI